MMRGQRGGSSPSCKGGWGEPGTVSLSLQSEEHGEDLVCVVSLGSKAMAVGALSGAPVDRCYWLDPTQTNLWGPGLGQALRPSAE